jgi:signal transduction histidine kinase
MVFFANLPSHLPPDTSFCLFRVLQEALLNSAKHSGGRRFKVELFGASDAIHLTVRDSGLGFNSEAAMKGRGTIRRVYAEVCYAPDLPKQFDVEVQTAH